MAISPPEADGGFEYDKTTIVVVIVAGFDQLVPPFKGFPKDASENLCFSLLVKQSLPRRE
jgi:hypothetical protein